MEWKRETCGAKPPVPLVEFLCGFCEGSGDAGSLGQSQRPVSGRRRDGEKGLIPTGQSFLPRRAFVSTV
eukprot:scaffold462_cov195-Pinguiococcus_pyrenoidosus.AAC.72